jgi:hypothetical protein
MLTAISSCNHTSAAQDSRKQGVYIGCGEKAHTPNHQQVLFVVMFIILMKTVQDVVF